MKLEPAPKYYEVLKEGSAFMQAVKATSNPEVAEALERANEEYFYWDRFKHKYQATGLPAEHAWAYLRFMRTSKLKRIALNDTKGKPFGYWIPDSFLKALHFLDQNTSGSILVDDPNVHAAEKDRFIISSLMEEAIASSQIEGAATTRKVAKAMLRSGRKPKDHSEQMILNNYLTMRMIKKFIDQPLSVKMILNIHASITQDTLEDASSVGRFRGENLDEQVKIYWDDGTILHTPPPASELKDRIAKLCEFANKEDKVFIHPVVKATILHFWLAYDHPFVDGNGRTARALFYWYMLKKGYWLVEFLSISRVIKRSQEKYAKAYLYSEKDEEDLTYFIFYHLKIIESAVNELKTYLKRKIQERKEAETYLLADSSLSYRQSQFLRYAITHPTDSYTIELYKNTYATTYETARSDLQALENRRYLKKYKRDKKFFYVPVDNLHEKLMRKAEKGKAT